MAFFCHFAWIFAIFCMDQSRVDMKQRAGFPFHDNLSVIQCFQNLRFMCRNNQAELSKLGMFTLLILTGSMRWFVQTNLNVLSVKGGRKNFAIHDSMKMVITLNFVENTPNFACSFVWVCYYHFQATVDGQHFSAMFHA